MAPDFARRSGRLRSVFTGLGIFVFLVIVGGSVWTFTPSYAIYRIQQALEAHDYPTFSRYVDVDRVLDHALDELGPIKPEDTEESAPRDSLATILQQGLKRLTRDARGLIKAGVGIAVEQAITDRNRSLPQIPTIAVVGALWLGKTDGDTRSLPVRLKNGEQIEVKLQRDVAWRWRVVEVANVRTLLSMLKDRYTKDR